MNSTLPGCRVSYPSPRSNDTMMLPWTRENPIGPRLECTAIALHSTRGDSSRAGAIAASTDFWSDLDGPSANRLMCLRAERCANWPPLLLKPLSALPGLERTMGLIHPYPTPVALGSRLYRWMVAGEKERRIRRTQSVGVSGVYNDGWDKGGLHVKLGLASTTPLSMMPIIN